MVNSNSCDPTDGNRNITQTEGPGSDACSTTSKTDDTGSSGKSSDGDGLPSDEPAIEPIPTKTDSTIPTIKPKNQTRKLLCLYCDRSFVSANLRQKHVERVHSIKSARRVSARRQNSLSPTPCGHCDKLNASDHTLNDLFEHLVQDHSSKYFGCLSCKERFTSRGHLIDHNNSMHFIEQTSLRINLPHLEEEEDVLTRSKVRNKPEDIDFKRKKLKNKKISVKSSKVALKRSKRLQQQQNQGKDSEGQTQKKRRDRKPSVVNKIDTNVKQKCELVPCVNPYPEFDSFYRVKKITDHSIDNLKISSLTFDDVFDKAFFNRIKCNIQENLLHHIDGKLFKNEESESRISNFEKVSSITPQEVQNTNVDNFGCEISLNAITPAPALLLTSQFGEDFESQIEYGSKPSKKKTQIKSDEVHYKYFTRRKYQASILQQKENRDLSKLDMWTQMLVKERQQNILNKNKNAKEILEYVSGQEYKSKMKREELNKILDRRGPFEDLKEEATKKAAFDKLNSTFKSDISQEVFSDVREVVNDLLSRVFQLVKEDKGTIKEPFSTVEDQREIPAYLDLRRKTSSTLEDIDKSDRIALICSSQETENFELPTNSVRDKDELVELTGEWARSRMYICAACGGKFSSLKYLIEHKSLYHQNVWVQHYEFVGNQSELYKHLSIPGLGKVGVVEDSVPCKQWKRSDARLCTKCDKKCNALGELHRHILECGGDWTWMLARKKCKYRPYGTKTRRKRRGFEPKVPNKRKTEPSEKKNYKKPVEGPRQRPSDAETIQRMLANLPAKRSRRSLISLSDVVFKSRNYKKSSLSPTTKLKKKSPSQDITNNTRALRSFNKVLSTRILDLNSSLMVKRKMQVLRSHRLSKSLKEETSIEDKKLYTDQAKALTENSANIKNKRLLSGRLNLKNYFPIKKKNNSRAKNEVQKMEKTSLMEVALKQLKNKKGGLKGFVRGLSLRKRNAQTEEDENVQEAKRKKLQRPTLNKTKKVKIDNNPKIEEGPFLDQSAAAETKDSTIKPVAPLVQAKDSPQAADFVHIATSLPDCKENPPIPETIFNLENNEEKSLQAKGNEEPPAISVSTETCVKPSTLKGKIRKPNRGLNDCIAMLTSKLQKKDDDKTMPSLNNVFCKPPIEVEKPETFIVEEIALDLSKKSNNFLTTEDDIAKPELKRTNVDETIDFVVNSSSSWFENRQIKPKKKKRSEKLITNIIFGKDKLIIAPASDFDDPLIARIKENENKLNSLKQETPPLDFEPLPLIIEPPTLILEPELPILDHIEQPPKIVESQMKLPSDSEDEVPLAVIAKNEDQTGIEDTVNTDSLKENSVSKSNTRDNVAKPTAKKKTKTKKKFNVVDAVETSPPQTSLKRPKRKPKSSKKIDKVEDDLFKNFSLVINKKTKRIPPISIVMDDAIEKEIVKDDETLLNDSVEEMDMELDDTSFNISIIERNDQQISSLVNSLSLNTTTVPLDESTPKRLEIDNSKVVKVAETHPNGKLPMVLDNGQILDDKLLEDSGFIEKLIDETLVKACDVDKIIPKQLETNIEQKEKLNVDNITMDENEKDFLPKVDNVTAPNDSSIDTELEKSVSNIIKDVEKAAVEQTQKFEPISLVQGEYVETQESTVFKVNDFSEMPKLVVDIHYVSEIGEKLQEYEKGSTLELHHNHSSQKEDFEDVHLTCRSNRRSRKQINYNEEVLVNPVDSFIQNTEVKKRKPDDYNDGSSKKVKVKKNKKDLEEIVVVNGFHENHKVGEEVKINFPVVEEQPIEKTKETDVIDLDLENGYSNKFEIDKVEKLDEDISPPLDTETPLVEAKERQVELAKLNIKDLLFSSMAPPESSYKDLPSEVSDKAKFNTQPSTILTSVLNSTESLMHEIQPLSEIINSSALDIAPVLDEIDKSLESEDVYDFQDDLNDNIKKSKNKTKSQNWKLEERKKIEEMENDQELRRSRRGSRKVASYNENDLIDPLIDALENRRNRVARKSNKEQKLNSNELFDMLKKSSQECGELSKTSVNSDLSICHQQTSNGISQCLEEDSETHGEINSKADKIYEFTEDSQEEAKEQYLKNNRKKPISNSNYCDICKKSFIRTENLIKHKMTLTHISKLSELEAREAEERAKLIENKAEPETEEPTEFATIKSLSPPPLEVEKEELVVTPKSPMNHTLQLVDIISDVLNKPVVMENFSSPSQENQDLNRRCKSLGERKSFESDHYLAPTAILENQINLLENIIGNNMENIGSNKEESFSDEEDLTMGDFVKPPQQYEEISDDSSNVKVVFEEKQRKTLNRDEELFLECCSLLKSGSEVSSYSKQALENKKPVQTAEDAHEFSDNSRTPTPLGDTYDDDASNSNTISSNWHLNSERPPGVNQSFSFEEVKNKEDSNMTFGEILSQGLQHQFNTRGYEDEKREDSDSSSNSKKVATKGARKVYEGLKVSIPTEDLDLEVLNNKKPLEEQTMPLISPTKNRSTRKSKPVKKSQVGSNVLFKVSKKKSSPSQVTPSPLKEVDIYNFEETLDNNDVFVKPYTASDNESLGYADSIGADAKSVSSVSSISAMSAKKPEGTPENITKKKYKIMEKIFKNAAKSKMEDEIEEELRHIPEIPEMDNLELVENYVRSCQRVQSPFLPPPPPLPLDELPKKPKMTEEEMSLLFDQLLGKDIANNEPLKQKSIKTKSSEGKKKNSKIKSRKRPRGNSESSDDEFNISKTTKKRSNRKNGQEDSGINLELELKECIGVASRKSQRTCTSGKQNILVEYWSSDEEAFEAMLENSHKTTSSKNTDKTKKPNNNIKAKNRIQKPLAAVQKKTSADISSSTTLNSNRRKRAAANPLYHWSSSSEDETEALIEVKPAREEEDDDDRPVQHGWIVGDSPKKLVTMLALTKGKKSTDLDTVKEQSKKRNHHHHHHHHHSS
ncbi:hypothetical protein ABEB36_013093 [Hypothenemus hampei]|uniref:C2H2-type domain-containing protein n=1 Tax=Hypothenemus hampei TaxID=57062 RepID=A0ABD1E731_HYPHA